MTRQNINTGNTANDGTGDGLRTAFTKVNQNFIEVYSQSSNTWISPTTSNTFNVIQVSGATKVSLPPGNVASVNTVSNRTGTAYEVYFLRTTEIDDIFMPLWDGDENTTELRIYIDGNSSTGFITTYNQNEWILIYDDGPVSYTANTTNVDISLTYEPTPQPWFDPEALGYTDFRGAKLQYHAYVDNVKGVNRIGQLFYAASDGLRYSVQSDYEDSRYDDQNFDVTSRRSTDKLYYSNSSEPYGNLHIQWTGVVWTGKDRNYEEDVD